MPIKATNNYKIFRYKINQLVAAHYPNGMRTQLVEQCAEALGIDRATVYRTMNLKRGKKSPTGREIKGRREIVHWFAEFFGVPYETMLNKEPMKERDI